jgi:hypothetical protein
MDEVLHAGEVGVASRGKAELPARVFLFAEPVGVVEGRTCQTICSRGSDYEPLREILLPAYQKNFHFKNF